MTTPTPATIEAKLQDVIFPDLQQGRADWDLPHTKAVVAYLKQILAAHPELNVDPLVLLIAAYAHDWGYVATTTDRTWDSVMSAKKKHMIVGAEKLAELLDDPYFDFLQEEQKERAVHLVRVHDQLRNLNATDELILMEADTLGAFDIDTAGSMFDEASNRKYEQGVLRARRPQFITDYSKEVFADLLKKRRQFYA